MKAVFAGALVLLTSGAALAVDGTVHFTGQIVDAPCVVAIGSQDQDVNLGQVKTLVFSAAGDKSPAQPFQINLENCVIGSTFTKANVSFSGIGDTDNAALLAIDNQAGAASGVGIGIYDNTNTLVDLNTGSSETTLRTGQTVLYYTAAYVQAGATAVTPGYGDSSVDFNITYN